MKQQILANAHTHDFAKEIYDSLGKRFEGDLEFETVEFRDFEGGEMKPILRGNTRKRNVFYFHDLAYPNPKESFFDALVAVGALEEASVGRVNLITPYTTFARQDKKEEGERSCITPTIIAHALHQFPRLDEIVTFDLHADQTQGVYKPIKMENLKGRPVLGDFIKENYDPANVVVCSPDIGGEKRAEAYAIEVFGEEVPFGMFMKRRKYETGPKIKGYEGPDLNGKNVLLVDDMLATGSTLVLCKEYAEEHYQPASVEGAVTHLLATPRDVNHSAEDYMRQSGLQIIATDSVLRSDAYYKANEDWLRTVSLKPKLTDVIYEMITDGSVSELFRPRR